MSCTSKDAAASPAGPQRRAKKLLAPSVKYEIFLQLVRGEVTINAAAEAAGVDRLAITDPAILPAELDRIQLEYNTTRLHSGIGYVTPEDEHEGRGEAIRAARRKGLHDAAQRRLAHHRQRRNNQIHNHRPAPPEVD